MKVSDIREMSIENIQAEIDTIQKDLMDLRMRNRIGAVDNPIEIREKKKTLARMKTIVGEKSRQSA